MKTNSSSGWYWHLVRDEKLAENQRDNDGRCEAALYGCMGLASEVHHVVERADGGTGDPSNLAALCAACHYRLTTEANQRRAQARREQKRQAQRRNHPGRIDRRS